MIPWYYPAINTPTDTPDPEEPAELDRIVEEAGAVPTEPVEPEPKPIKWREFL